MISISPGSLIYDVKIIYATEVPKLEAFEAFAKSITGESDKVRTFYKHPHC